MSDIETRNCWSWRLGGGAAVSLSRTCRLGAVLALLALAGCNTPPAAGEPDPTGPPPPPRAEVVQRTSYAEDPPRGTEATLGGVGSVRVCLLDVSSQPTDDCMTMSALDQAEWDRYQVGDSYPVEGTPLDPEGER